MFLELAICPFTFQPVETRARAGIHPDRLPKPNPCATCSPPHPPCTQATHLGISLSSSPSAILVHPSRTHVQPSTLIPWLGIPVVVQVFSTCSTPLRLCPPQLLLTLPVSIQFIHCQRSDHVKFVRRSVVCVHQRACKCPKCLSSASQCLSPSMARAQRLCSAAGCCAPCSVEHFILVNTFGLISNKSHKSLPRSSSCC